MSGVYTSTLIRFSDALVPGETRYAAVAELAYAPTARLSVSAGLGAGFGGGILAPDGSHKFGPGVVASLGVSYRFLEGNTPIGRGFVAGSALVSFTGTTTQLGTANPSVPYDALDLRIGAAAGFTWLRTVSLYVVGRAFGGPVYWSYHGESELGTDTHHYQVGGGVAVLLFRHVDLFAEGVPLGEQAVAAGVSVPF